MPIDHKPIDEQIRSAIQASNEIWFPSLASELASQFLGTAPALSERNVYGTARWLAQDANDPRTVAGLIGLQGETIPVETLSENYVAAFGDVTLRREVCPSDITLLDCAMATIEATPTLAEAVLHLVRSIHVLEAAEGYDVSYSAPSIPFSIFVSVPNEQERDAAIRVAENIVHEAMHLQLSLIERHMRLVLSEATVYSPWKQSQRPASGLLHGFYVFSVLHLFLSQLAEPQHAPYARRRLLEIEDELSRAPNIRESLTPAGSLLLSRCATAVGF